VAELGSLGAMSTASLNTDRKLSSPARIIKPFLFLVWAFSTLYAAFHIALYIFLIHLYGFSRVRSEHLYFTSTPKARAWIVSNGDRITEGHFLHWLISA